MKFILTKTLITLVLLGNYYSQSNNFQIENYLSNIQITDITKVNDELWISTDGSGIYKYSYDKDTWKNYSTQEGNLTHNFFYCIAASDRYVWAGSTDGLFILDKRRNRWTKRKFGVGGQLSNWIRSLDYDEGKNILWIGRFRYLSMFDLRKKRFYDFDLTVGNNEKTNTIKLIHTDGDSLIWFGTEAGIHKYYKSRNIEDNNSRQFINNSNGNFNGDGKSVSIAAMITSKNIIWFGLDEFLTTENPDFNIGGIYKYDRRNNWIRFDLKDGLPGNGIYCLEETGNYIWAALYEFDKIKKEQYGRGIAIINKATGDIKNITDPKIPNSIFCMLFDNEFLWLGSENGLLRIDLRNRFSPTFSLQH